jgi:FlgD Ig-like domain
MRSDRSIVTSVALAFCSTALLASLAFGEPAVRVSYPDGVPQVELTGDYPMATYNVVRSDSPTGTPERIGGADILCLGSCWAADPDAAPGRTYWYRFDLQLADGSRVVFGPYAVTISATLAARVQARLEPNPWRGAAHVVLRLGTAGGTPVAARATLHDIAGRRVRTLASGTLPRGVTSIAWDGRDDRGAILGAGAYFLRLESPLGNVVTRVVRLP